MANIIQEKYDINFKPVEQTSKWVEPSMRAASNRRQSCLRTAVDDSDPSDSFRQSAMAGETDVSDGVNQRSLIKGFSRLPMRPTEDMYTNEHRDNFYDDVGGFVERNNYLDRS